MKRCSSSLAIREMQIKPKMRYYFTPARMAIIKKIDNNKCWRGCGEIGASHCWQDINYAAALENSLTVSQKLPCNSTTRSIPKRNETCPHKNMFMRDIPGGSVVKTCSWGTSLVAQWLRIHLPMQGTQVQALVREDPTCCGATKPMCHNY